MEIKELLEIMLDNVNQGREAAHGLIGYNGVVNIQHPEQVHRKPEIYITFDEFREIRNTPDHSTAHYRLNLAIEKLLKAKSAPPVVLPYVIPEGYVWNDWKGDSPEFYGRYRADGWTDERLISEDYLLQKPTRFKPFVNWVSTGCGHVWPKGDYVFTEDQFSSITPKHFRGRLVNELNTRNTLGFHFAGIVQNYYQPISPNGMNEMEDLVNKRLNEIYQQL